jgi:HD-like signal output (HDOD) protein
MIVEVILVVLVVSILLLLIWRLSQSSTPTKTGSNRPQSAYQPPIVATPVIKKSKIESPKTDSQHQTPAFFNFSINDLSPAEISAFLSFELFEQANISPSEQAINEKIGQQFKRPHPLLQPLTKSTFETKELFDLIKTDPEITAKILNAVNSPLFALRKPITSISHAIIFLGVNAVKNIAIQFAVENSMQHSTVEQKMAYQKLWKASYMASSICLLMAQNLNKENAAELSTQCLLCYLGDMALITFKPALAGDYIEPQSLYQRVRRSQQVLNTNAALVGKSIVSQWQLPPSIEDAVEQHLSILTDSSLLYESLDTAIQNRLVCYLACRIGDLVSFSGLRDLSQMEKICAESLHSLDFYYIQENIKSANLAPIIRLFNDSGFLRKSKALIEAVSAKAT